MANNKIFTKLCSDIEQFGWHVLYVCPEQDEEGACFAYTVGLTATFSHPEIMIFGLSQQTAHSLLQVCVDKIKAGQHFQAHQGYDDIIANNYQVMFKPVNPAYVADYMGLALRYYQQTSFNALILCWPDKHHAFPWQAAHAGGQTEVLMLMQPTT
ncbi:DUF4262 domain-containing protein [Agitococcus lubricus]|uniref:Uncharacterized protein DUF4262 n=1 Tax=Agitococcus lubricus TaxID=1077255 RepID=A0A2T5IV28_9GAMM|nr:DUF4262 domain-containing protein [Agitococcus lubricus]PTQ87723.1 uncharacterized protein DUF4262 [Agitococcus lubricus]